MQPFVIHAHFYQPERANPWTGVLDPEPSAAPARDWNHRIHDECYRPNGTARIFDDRRRVERIVNNYERLSFNFGPTLLRWMERRQPDTYARILDGDWRSASRTGHGNALAQAYNHMILPLASERDRGTQIAWGLADFRHRFSRPAEGMWLPETAADAATMDALIDARVRFTVLAPHQAHRVRHRGGDWHEVGAGIDPGRPYRLLHSDGSGRSIAVFFYDGGLAQTLAFDRHSTDAAALVERLHAAVPSGGGLVHAALDGETFGHHHRFGELGLAYALFENAERHGLRPTSYAAWLAEHPPVDEVEIVGGEGTAWSCAHGVGRWARDCGCSTDGLEGWNQAWRAPLRAGLDAVRDAAAAAFSERGAELLRDPWAARDAYIGVRLGTVTPAAFLDRHSRRHLTDRQKTELWTLLEAQRHAMVMYTSCGWFFNDISGLETVYVLRSAARTLGLLEDLGAAGSTREDLLAHLAEARSNKPEAGSGADVWRDQVEPATVTPRRVVAHLALLALAQPDVAMEVSAAAPLQMAGHSVTLRESRIEKRGRLSLGTARVAVSDTETGRVDELVAAGMHMGGIDFYGITAPDSKPDRYAEVSGALWDAFAVETMPQLVRRIWEFAGPDAAIEEFDLDSALPGGRQHIVGSVFRDLTARFQEQYSRLYRDHHRILEMLARAGYELPRDLRAAAELTLSAQLDDDLADARKRLREDSDATAFARVRATVRAARDQGYSLDLSGVRDALTGCVTEAARLAARTLADADADRLEGWLGLARGLEVEIDLSRPQELVWEAASRARAGRLGAAETAVVGRLGEALGLAPVAWSKPA